MNSLYPGGLLLEKVGLTSVRSFFSHPKGRFVECDADQVTLTKRLVDWAILTILPLGSLDQLSSFGHEHSFVLVFCELFLCAVDLLPYLGDASGLQGTSRLQIHVYACAMFAVYCSFGNSADCLLTMRVNYG